MLSVARRYFRLGDGYGPLTLPQGNGTPAPPGTVLFDWDPSWNPYVDRVGGITLAPVGTAPTLAVTNGLVGMSFGGSGALEAASSPFAALSDLTGGVSIYVVAERTDAASEADGLVSIDQTAAASSRECLAIHHTAADAVAMLSADGATSNSDTASPVSRNQVTVYSGHATVGFLTARVDGGSLGVGTTVSSVDPEGLDRIAIGDSYYFGAGGLGFTGNIYRVLICEGAYDAAVLTYLQGQHTAYAAPSAGYDGPEPENLALWWSATSPTVSLDDTATTFTVAGTPTISELRGRDCMVCATDADGYTASSPWGTLADGDYTLAVLCEGPTGVTVTGGETLASVDDGGALANYLRANLNRTNHYTNAQCKGTIARSDVLTSPLWVDDTVLVISATLRISGAAWEIEAGLDETLTGSPFVSASGPPTGIGAIKIPNVGVSDSANNYRIWDVFLFESEIPSGFTTWAKALLT